MSQVATRSGVHGRAVKCVRGRGRRGRAVVVASVMAIASVAVSHGFSAAAGEAAVAKSAEAVPDATSETIAAPINLAGRWTGPHYGYARIGPKAARESGGGPCGDKPCVLTYDIVKCETGWCGIAVSNATPCGAIGLRMTGDAAPNRQNAFTGKLELAKGAAPYVIESWYSAPDGSGGEAAPRLSLIGDTGTELLMMRRSFPFQAELTRISDAQCTLEKATS